MSANGDRLSEAQRALLDKFPQLEADDPIVEMAAWNAALEQRLEQFGGSIEVWSTAILRQAEASQQQGQLFVSQSSTLSEIAANNSELLTVLQQLKPSVERLHQELAEQQHSVARLSEGLTSLNHSVPRIEGGIVGLKKSEGRLREEIAASSSRGQLRWGVVLLSYNLALLIFISVATRWQVVQTRYQERLVNSALIRLERVERALGTAP